MKDVYYSKCADYSLCGPALESILAPQIENRGGVRGKCIMLKPNLLAWKHEQDIACVHPRVIVETARIFLDAGASEVALLENPAVQSVASIIRSMGIEENLKSLGVRYANFLDYRTANPPNGVRFHNLQIAHEYQNFDFVADLAKAKTHAMMTLTLCVKNLFGLVDSSSRLGWHLAVGRNFEQFADMLLDLYLTIRPAFNVVDACICMEGNGPGSGTPAIRNFFAGGTDALTTDASVASRLGVPDLLLIQNAKKRDLLDEWRDCGELPEIDPLRLPDPPGLSLEWGVFFPPFLRDFLRRKMLSTPILSPDRCVGCGVCVDMCPPRSLQLVNGKPLFCLDECIRCYCCQEHCPKGAITPRKTFLMKCAESFAGWFHH